MAIFELCSLPPRLARPSANVRLNEVDGGDSAQASCYGARKFSVKLPAWITRRMGCASASKKGDTKSFDVTANNSAGHAEKTVHPEKIVQASIRAQVGGMRRQVELSIDKAAKKAGIRWCEDSARCAEWQWDRGSC